MIMTFQMFPESVIMGFLKGFFSQSTLYNNQPNPFLYIDGKTKLADGSPSLVISMSENEYVNPCPAIIIQEGGFTEDIRAINNNANVIQLLTGKREHMTPMICPITLHCIGANKGHAKLLSAIVAMAISRFRSAIYEMGIDHISPLQGSPPSRMTSQDKQAPSQPYDCMVMFQTVHHQHFDVTRRPYGEIDVEEQVRLTIYNAINNIEFDEDGNPTTPATEWIKKEIDIGE